MARIRSLIASVTLCGVLAISLAACSTPTPQDNSAAACDAYDAFVQSVSDAKDSLSTSSTIGEITEARDEVKSSYADLDKALTAVSEDRRATLEDAWASFDDAVAGIDKDLTVPEAASTLTDDLAKIEAAQTALNEDLVCE